MLNFTKRLFWRPKRAYSLILIGNKNQMRDYRETSRALKSKEKNGLKLGLEECGKPKFFNVTFTIFSFSNCFENLIM